MSVDGPYSMEADVKKHIFDDYSKRDIDFRAGQEINEHDNVIIQRFVVDKIC